MQIERVTIAALPRLAELFQQFWGEIASRDAMQATFKRISANPAYILLAARQAGRLVGFVMGVVCEDLYGDGRPFMVMEDLIVDKGQRRQGVGQALMEALEKTAIERNCGQIIFVTEANRTDSIRFYQSLGYDAGAHRGFKKNLRGDRS
ncbi:MAG: GNAT family N-acetyltransferase [Desulfobacterales bacterium]|nr:GNAT family N-acetyltransferase [Desulfobacterales bacterium]